MPSAIRDVAVTTPGTTVRIPVLANDTGSGLTITSFGQGAHGSVTIEPDLALSYSPEAGFSGADSFVYSIRDAEGLSSTSEVTVTVANDNDLPLAANDYVETVADQPVTVPIMSNDVDPDGGSLRLSALSTPGYGTAQVLDNDSILYVPQEGFEGIDALIYTIMDEDGGTAAAVVTINVLGANAIPVALDDVFSVTAGASTTIDVLSNDEDPDGGSLTFVAFSLPLHGTLNLNADNTFTYTPGAGFIGSDTFTYTVRDNRNSTATGRVTLTVVEQNNTPAAFEDQLEATAGTPVTFDVRANDTDPEGDPLRVIASTLPAHGSLNFNLDGTLTYTPRAGFVGDDSFVYTIGDGEGGSASAAVTITVAAGGSGPGAFPNGYSFQRRLIIPADLVDGTADHENFPLLIDETGDWLKTEGPGGRIEHAQGHDIRFELPDGTKLDHDVELFDGVDGRLVAWVRLPALSIAEDTHILMYYGNAGVTAPEAAPSGVWSDHLAVWHLPDPTDRSGGGHDLTLSGSVGSGTLVGEAASFDGDAVFTLQATDWLAGHGAFALEIWLKADAPVVGSDHGLLAAGLINGNDDDLDISLRYDERGFQGGRDNIITAELQTTGGRSRFESAGGEQREAPQHIALSWESGDRLRMWIDGTEIAPSNELVATSGTTQITGTPLTIGAGAKDSPSGGWQGLIDGIRIRNVPWAPERAATEHLNQTAPKSFYGLGGEVDADTIDHPPIAVPASATAKSGQYVDVDVLGRSFDLESQGSLSIVETFGADHGAASVVDKKVRYAAEAGFTGNAQFGYTIKDPQGAKSSSFVRVDVTSFGGAGGRNAPNGPGPLSGLPWHSGGSNYSVGQLREFENFRGRKTDMVVIFGPKDNWYDLQGGDPNNLDNEDGWFRGFFQQHKYSPRLVLTWGFLPESHHADKTPQNLNKAANGEFDVHYIRFAEKLKHLLEKYKQTDAIFRMSWEPNGPGYPWGYANESTNRDQSEVWRDTWARVADIIRSRIPWLPFEVCFLRKGKQSKGVQAALPPKQYFELLGCDHYNRFPLVKTLSDFNDQKNKEYQGGPWGIRAWAQFAISQGKLWSTAEWGVRTDSSHDEGGDWPAYIEGMYGVFEEFKDHIGYEAYFSQVDSALHRAENGVPNAKAKYKELWGR